MHVLASLAVVGCALVLLSVLRHLVSPLRSIPGPFLARFTDLWYLFHVRGGHFEKVNQELHENYGPIVRYGPNRYSFATLTAGKEIYGHGSAFLKSFWYSAASHPEQWTLFSDRDAKRHAANRRLYASTYSMSSLISYEPYVDECADLLSQRLAELARAGAQVNLGHWLQCYAFDVIGAITYSRRLGFLDQGHDVGNLMKTLDRGAATIVQVGIYAWVHLLLFRLRNWLAGPKGAGRSYVENFTQECIKEHQASPKAMDMADATDEEAEATAHGDGRAIDFLTKFWARHTRDPDVFTVFHISAACAQNMAAGSDTTAITLSAIVYYLLKNPSCMKKLREEVGKLESSEKHVDRNVTFRDSQDMPYLQAVIKEAMRLHPATGLPLERVVPVGGATISGRFFPAGTNVAISTWVENRLAAVFGNDANEFRPERWLIEDSEQLAFMNRHWIPFGLGSRNCIGRHISMLEISKLIPRIVRDFDFELAGDLAKPGSSWLTNNHLFVKPVGFVVNVKLGET